MKVTGSFFEHKQLATESFDAQVAAPLSSGDQIAVMMGSNQTRAVTTVAEYRRRMTKSKQAPGSIPEDLARFPIIASISCAGKTYLFVPALLTAKVDFKAGETIQIDKYQITSRRTFKAGETVPVLWVNINSLISLGSVVDPQGEQPEFVAHQVDTEASQRDSNIQAWRITLNRFH